MPQFRSYTYLMEAIEADILTVWPQVKKIYRGFPRVEPNKGFVYAVIWMNPEDPVGQEPSGQGMMQTPRITITKVEPLPAASVAVQDRIVSDANAMIAQLERSHLYAVQSDGTHKAQDPWANIGPIDSQTADQVFAVNVSLEVSIRELHESKV